MPGAPGFLNSNPGQAPPWGTSREEALRNIHKVAQMVIESMIEDGEPLPSVVAQVDEPVVAVTV